jgi:hypothetical protein
MSMSAAHERMASIPASSVRAISRRSQSSAYAVYLSPMLAKSIFRKRSSNTDSVISCSMISPHILIKNRQTERALRSRAGQKACNTRIYKYNNKKIIADVV